MVGVIHTPRVLTAIGRGLVRRQRIVNSAGTDDTVDSTALLSRSGVGESNAFWSSPSRAGLLDCDYLMHLNNAAYLSQAEYARWEWCAYSGLMQSLWRDKTSFVLAGGAIRYRREIPMGQKYQIQSFMAHINDQNLLVYQAFRGMDGKSSLGAPIPGRIRAQFVCRGLLVKGRTILNPREYLIDNVGVDAESLQEISSSDGGAKGGDVMDKLMDHYGNMEEAFKTVSSRDDEGLR